MPGQVDGHPCFTSAILEPCERFLVRNLLVAKSIVDPSGPVVPVRVLNVSESPVTLYKGTVVGTCERATAISENCDQTSAPMNSCEGREGVPSHLESLWEATAPGLEPSQQTGLGALRQWDPGGPA